jgi:hypothetical protein
MVRYGILLPAAGMVGQRPTRLEERLDTQSPRKMLVAKVCNEAPAPTFQWASRIVPGPGHAAGDSTDAELFFKTVMTGSCQEERLRVCPGEKTAISYSYGEGSLLLASRLKSVNQRSPGRRQFVSHPLAEQVALSRASRRRR